MRQRWTALLALAACCSMSIAGCGTDQAPPPSVETRAADKNTKPGQTGKGEKPGPAAPRNDGPKESDPVATKRPETVYTPSDWRRCKQHEDCSLAREGEPCGTWKYAGINASFEDRYMARWHAAREGCAQDREEPPASAFIPWCQRSNSQCLARPAPDFSCAPQEPVTVPGESHLLPAVKYATQDPPDGSRWLICPEIAVARGIGAWVQYQKFVPEQSGSYTVTASCPNPGVGISLNAWDCDLGSFQSCATCPEATACETRDYLEAGDPRIFAVIGCEEGGRLTVTRETLKNTGAE